MAEKEKKTFRESIEEIQSKEFPDISVLAEGIVDERLNDTQTKVLAIMTYPGSLFMKQKDKAELVGITDRQWRNIVNDKDFLAVLEEYTRKVVPLRAAAEILNTQIMLATQFGSTKAAEFVFKYAQLLIDKSEIDVKATVKHEVAMKEKLQTDTIEGLKRFRVDIPNLSTDN